MDLIAVLEEEFGKFTVDWDTFDNCALTHIRHEDGTWETHQTKYAAALKPIALGPDINNTELVSPDLHHAFISLVGAVAYLLITRGDVAVYVVALQRVASKPRVST